VVASSVCDLVIVVTLATRGIAITALPLPAIAWTIAAAAAFGFILDMVKAPVFGRLAIS
jgi:H+-transporting ATPase